MVGSIKQRLDKITSELDSENLSTLLAFAEFLPDRQLDALVSSQYQAFQADQLS